MQNKYLKYFVYSGIKTVAIGLVYTVMLLVNSIPGIVLLITRGSESTVIDITDPNASEVFQQSFNNDFLFLGLTAVFGLIYYLSVHQYLLFLAYKKSDAIYKNLASKYPQLDVKKLSKSLKTLLAIVIPVVVISMLSAPASYYVNLTLASEDLAFSGQSIIATMLVNMILIFPTYIIVSLVDIWKK